MSNRQGAWDRAKALASNTPDSRNRYVDLLRALSICAVILGHWLVAAPYVNEGGLNLAGNLLQSRPWTQWLTWLFQVMPVFFLVGGYSNGISWRSATRAAVSYRGWLYGRLQRLVGPVLPLILFWSVLALAAVPLGISNELFKVGSQIALIPVWFLAVYIGTVVLVPLTAAAWQRYGLWSFAVLFIGVVVNDVLFLKGITAVGWLNYAFLWLAVHQLGYAWLDGRFSRHGKSLLIGSAALLLLLMVVWLFPYPLSMVSVPGDDISNSLPPKLPMLLLGLAQIGLLLALEKPARRWLCSLKPWATTVLVNGMIMTLFLWHLTAVTLVTSIAVALGDLGLAHGPGSADWWILRPVWLLLYVLLLMVLVTLFLRLEHTGGTEPTSVFRQVAGAVVVCAGLSLLALNGIGGNAHPAQVLLAISLPFIGAAVAGIKLMPNLDGQA